VDFVSPGAQSGPTVPGERPYPLEGFTLTSNDPFARLPEVSRFTVTSTTVSDGDAWPAEQMSGLFGVPAGKDISPQLSWSGAPEGTKGYAVTVYDPDAPTCSGFWHYIGAAPPAGHGRHRYVIVVHALDVEQIGVPAEATPAYLGFTMANHILGRAVLTVTAEIPA
jgi:phosphatidylethanolamine-binding protein (PEBP) family uncharacterized protein